MHLYIKLLLSKLLLIMTWLPFGYFPLFIGVSNYIWTRGSDLLPVFIIEAVLIALGLNGIIGLLTFKKQYLAKEMALTILIIGIITNLQTSVLAAINVTLIFFFWNIWVLGEKYAQLDKEYNYPNGSIDKQDINDAYQKQLQGFFIIGWLVLLGSWMIILISENIVVDLGATMTISLFLGAIILLLIFLSERLAIFPKLKKI
ncbi:hypothetical protein CEE45_14050 [Candidatus Heimdallarchaeota archaeon B3_Heim]|nr:MAG: hypothetical protein CEE45_14050 [Candidatus Heimdallarchaeota archaeon B3_Heim]